MRVFIKFERYSHSLNKRNIRNLFRVKLVQQNVGTADVFNLYFFTVISEITLLYKN